MRKRLLLLALALVAGALVYHLLSRFPGFVLISAGPYVIEAGLLTVLVLILLVTALVTLIKKLYRMIFLPGHWLQWRSDRRLHKDRTRTLRGIVDYMEGNWPSAIDHLKRSISRSEMPAVNYLGAASASFQMGDLDGANRLLDEAEKTGMADSFATNLLRARLCLLQQQFEKGLPLIQSLHHKDPSHPAVLRLLASARKGIRDWRGLEAMLPDLRRHKVLSENEMQQLEEEIYSQLLASFPGDHLHNASMADLQQGLDKLWSEVPRRLQKNTRLLRQYLHKLQQVGSPDKAETRLRRYLGRHWDEQLVLVYGLIQGNPMRQLATAEGWLASHPGNPELLHTLGRLAVRAELWGKAKAYYEQSLAGQRNPQVYFELASLQAELNEGTASVRSYRDGLLAALNASDKKYPELPG